MKHKLITYIGIFLVILTVISCKVGPNYHEPKITSPEIFRYENNQIDSIIDLKWWNSVFFLRNKYLFFIFT